jgi:cobalt/nickel transport system permease protein
LVFIVAVVSFGKYEITGLLPFIIYPVVLIAMGNLPPGYLAKKILLAAPFAFFIGIFNPLLDRAVLVHLGPIGISGGWVSFASIMIRFSPDRQRRLHINRRHRPQCGLSGPG